MDFVVHHAVRKGVMHSKKTSSFRKNDVRHIDVDDRGHVTCGVLDRFVGISGQIVEDLMTARYGGFCGCGLTSGEFIESRKDGWIYRA